MGDTRVARAMDIELWCASTRRWVSGFRIDTVLSDGSVRVARVSDGTVLPLDIPRRFVREPQGTTQGWWRTAPAPKRRRSGL
jgi:hypothetical protein